MIFAKQTKNRKRLLVWILYAFILTAGILYLHIKLINRANDDAYIHFRIARHLIQFGQPYFNLNEPVMGTSSPAWTLLLALIFTLFGTSLLSVSILNALLISAGMLLFSLFYTQKVRRYRPLLILLYSLVYAGLILFPSSGLMEISFCMASVGLGLYLLSKDRAAGYSFLALAVFIRYEMVVLFVLVSLVALFNLNAFSSKGEAKKSMLFKDSSFRLAPMSQIFLYSALGALPFLVFQLIFFRTLIPQTVVAKSKVYDLSFSRVFDNLISGLQPVGLPLDVFPWEICLIIVSILVLISFLVISRRGYRAVLHFLDLRVLFTLSGVIIFILYLIGRVYLFEWYVPLFSVPILLGVTSWFLSHPLKGFQWTGVLIGAVLGLATIIQAAAILITPVDQSYNFTHARVKAYLALGSELAAKYPHQTLLTAEIGALGWNFDGEIMDAVGLVTPQALKYHPMSVPQERSDGATGAIPPGLVKELKPDIIVSYDTFDEALRKSPEINDYIETKRPAFLPADMAKFPAGVWGSKTLSVFIRKSK